MPRYQDTEPTVAFTYSLDNRFGFLGMLRTKLRQIDMELRREFEEF
jgi:hypothetical protein